MKGKILNKPAINCENFRVDHDETSRIHWEISLGQRDEEIWMLYQWNVGSSGTKFLASEFWMKIGKLEVWSHW